MADTTRESNDNGKKTRRRNPQHPALTLEEAVERTRTLFGHDPRKPIAPEVAASHWELSTTSSTALQAISALKQYGLLEESKDAKGNRLLVLSDLARKIVGDQRRESPDRDQAIRDAALTPSEAAHEKRPI